MAAGSFPDTNWSLIFQSGLDDDNARHALNRLCRLYWQPLYIYGRRRGFGKEDAEDTVQTFLASMASRQSLAGLESRTVRFRSWLLAGYQHHLINLHRHAGAAKRGSGVQPLPFDGVIEMDAGSSHLSPDEAYDSRWARQVMENAVARLTHEQAGTSDEAAFALLLPLITGQSAATHRETGERLGLAESTVSVMIHRYRRRLREIFRHEVSHTVADQSEVEAEMSVLLELAARAQ